MIVLLLYISSVKGYAMFLFYILYVLCKMCTFFRIILGLKFSTSQLLCRYDLGVMYIFE